MRTHWRSGVFFPFLVWVVVAVAAVFAGLAGATVPGENGRILFAGREDFRSAAKIYSVNPDGTALRPLTSSEESEYSPAVSPDGERIAYVRRGDIWVMNIDGGDQQPIASGVGKEHSPSWSPDGERIAFVRSTPEGSRVYVMNADGSERTQLVRHYGRALRPGVPGERVEDGTVVALGDTPGAAGTSGPAETLEYRESSPVWSPSGKAIAFSSSIDGDGEIYIQAIGPDGPGLRGARQLTDNDVNDSDPAFSPGGTFLAYAKSAYGDAGDQSNIWMKRSDGSGPPERLTSLERDKNVLHLEPVFSPDGGKLLYERLVNTPGPGANSSLYVLDLASRTTVPLTSAPSWQGSPDWQTLGFDAGSGSGNDRDGTAGGSGDGDGSDQTSAPDSKQNDAPDEPHDRRRCTIIGTSGDDVLVGTPGRDVICGLGGDDVIRGLGGNDLIKAGAGDDIVKGGPGKDRILGQAGDDELYGQGGRDTIKAGPGDDELHGNKHPDRLYGQGGDDTFYARRGGRDLLKGGKGDDDAKADPRDRLRSIQHRL